jgi:hypothetical protein
MIAKKGNRTRPLVEMKEEEAGPGDWVGGGEGNRDERRRRYFGTWPGCGGSHGPPKTPHGEVKDRAKDKSIALRWAVAYFRPIYSLGFSLFA